MSLRAPAALLVLLPLTAWTTQVAYADRPTSPPRLVDGCKRDPQSSLCREVRRLCATKAVRDEVVPACKELGWWGDTTYREITNLCPIDPTHADCQSTKAACEGQRAGSIGEDGEKICREMGWGAYAYTKMTPGGGDDGSPAASGSDGDDSGSDGDGSDGDSSDGSGSDAEAEERSARGVFTANGAPGAGRTLRLHAWAAGVEGLGFRIGLVGDAAALGDHEALYTAHLDAVVLSFVRLPVALGFVGDVGLAGSDVAYQADLLLGAGRWWTPHLAAGLMGGVGVSGISGGGAPFAIDLPVRLVGIAHAGDRVSVEGWAQVSWLASTEASRGAGSSTVGFADAAEVGGALVWGQRVAADGGLGAGLWLGGVYQEQNGTRIVSIMVGLGAARNPWMR